MLDDIIIFSVKQGFLYCNLDISGHTTPHFFEGSLKDPEKRLFY